jgi:type IV secretory pathway TrbD component
MIDQNQEVTIHASCTRPVLLLGCDRTWFFGSLLVCVLVAASSQSWWGPPLAIAMWRGAIKLCRMYRNESRHKPHGLTDLLLPYALIEDGILLQQDGSQIAGWLFHGPDMASASPSEMAALCSQLNSILRLGDGWSSATRSAHKRPDIRAPAPSPIR